MAFLFGRSEKKKNDDLCRATKDLILRFSVEGEMPPPKVSEELTRNLSQMKLILQGTLEKETDASQVQQLIEHLIEHDVLYHLAKIIHRLPFEARKDVQIIFSNAFRFQPEHMKDPYILEYCINKRGDLVELLVRGYEKRESAMPCGSILREAVKNDSFAAMILYDEPAGPDGSKRNFGRIDPASPSSGQGIFWKFFDWIDRSAFETSADAFSTFRDLLTKHKKLVAHYLTINYDLFVARYNSVLIQSPSYVTKRQSIKLFGELLLERLNYEIMMRYIKSAAHLKIAMNLLKDERRMLNYEAFHIFKIFVANPEKSEEVKRILIMNRERMLKFLPGFLEDREEDMQFKDEKAYCIRMIEGLPSVAGRGASGSSSGGAQAQSQAGLAA